MFVDRRTIELSLAKMLGTAGHLLKIWFTLKHMGLTSVSPPIEIDTSNSTPSLQTLFSCGATDNRFYIPFAHTPRYMTMKHDASRSIIQTTIQRWASSGSVVTCDPTEFLDIHIDDGAKIQVSTGRRYPFGLGVDESGFALKDGTRVCIPIISFAVWFGRYTDIPSDVVPEDYLVSNMLAGLNISPAEREIIFIDDDLTVSTQSTRLTDSDIFAACSRFIDGNTERSAELRYEDFSHYTRRIKSMVSGLDQPTWMRISPSEEVQDLLQSGSKSILLYGPPRTGKTRMIDSIIARNSDLRCTIQIHDGWGYDHLIEGLKPDTSGNWDWKDGPLKEAIVTGKKYIILDEINRTAIAQALGEVFSLIEEAYRGEANGITLRSGDTFWIPEDVVFLMSMNTVDKSTEDIDDALMGRVAAVEFPARPEDLNEMLIANGVPIDVREQLTQLYVEILNIYPLGHGYFAGLKGIVNNNEVIRYYKARVRPVLLNFLGRLKTNELALIDNTVDGMFGRS